MIGCSKCGKELTEGVSAFVSRTFQTGTEYKANIYCLECSNEDESYLTTVADIESGIWWADHLAEDMGKIGREIGRKAAERMSEMIEEVVFDAIKGDVGASPGKGLDKKAEEYAKMIRGSNVDIDGGEIEAAKGNWHSIRRLLLLAAKQGQGQGQEINLDPWLAASVVLVAVAVCVAGICAVAL